MLEKCWTFAKDKYCCVLVFLNLSDKCVCVLCWKLFFQKALNKRFQIGKNCFSMLVKETCFSNWDTLRSTVHKLLTYAFKVVDLRGVCKDFFSECVQLLYIAWNFTDIRRHGVSSNGRRGSQTDREGGTSKRNWVSFCMYVIDLNDKRPR